MNLLKALTPHAEEKEICVFFSMMACVACYSVPDLEYTTHQLYNADSSRRAVVLHFYYFY